MRYLSGYIAIVCLLFLRPFAGTAEELSIAKNRDVNELIQKISDSNKDKNVPMVLSLSKQLFAEYGMSDSPDIRLTAFAYLGQAYMVSHQYDSASYYLNSALDYFEEIKVEIDNTSVSKPLVMIYNALAIISIDHYLDFERAVSYFIKGLDALGRPQNLEDYAIIKYNLVVSYFFLNNPIGIEYAMELYEESVRENDDKAGFMGAYACAMMYFLSKDYSLAETYIKEAVRSPYLYMDPSGVYNLYANILRDSDSFAQADKMYEKAIQSIKSPSITTTYVYLSYGKYLIMKGENDKAINMLSKGIETADLIGNRVHMFELMHSISEAYENKGMWETSLKYYKNYKIYSDSLFNISKERALYNMQIKYDKERYAAEKRESEMLLEKKNTAILGMSVIILLVLGLSLVIFVLYRYKDKMYKKIAKQYKASGRKDKLIAENVITPRISQNKADELFSELELLMIQNKVFKDSTLTRDKVAEMLNTNRTYLSSVINDKTGEPFNQYLNSYRINYALQLLSDEKEEVSMKVIYLESGFNSPTTFYKSFREIVGMPPSKYREVLNMRK